MSSVWGSANVILRCSRCGCAVKVRRELAGRPAYCSDACQGFAVRERRYSHVPRRWWERQRILATTPLHQLYPEMIDVLDRVQRERPSWAAWAGCGAQRDSDGAGLAR